MTAVLERATKKEQVIAKESLPDISRLIRSISKQDDPISLEVNDHELIRVKISFKVLKLLREIISMMADGKAFTLIPQDSEVSTQQAAEMLNVSRPFIVKLLESGVIPYKKIGAHRRIQIEDLLAYTRIQDARKEDALQKLSDEAQKLGLGY